MTRRGHTGAGLRWAQQRRLARSLGWGGAARESKLILVKFWGEGRRRKGERERDEEGNRRRKGERRGGGERTGKGGGGRTGGQFHWFAVGVAQTRKGDKRGEGGGVGGGSGGERDQGAAMGGPE